MYYSSRKFEKAEMNFVPTGVAPCSLLSLMKAIIIFLSSQGLPLARKRYKELKARLLRIELPNKCHGLQVSVFAGRFFFFFYTAAILKNRTQPGYPKC